MIAEVFAVHLVHCCEIPHVAQDVGKGREAASRAPQVEQVAPLAAAALVTKGVLPEPVATARVTGESHATINARINRDDFPVRDRRPSITHGSFMNAPAIARMYWMKSVATTPQSPETVV